MDVRRPYAFIWSDVEVMSWLIKKIKHGDYDNGHIWPFTSSTYLFEVAWSTKHHIATSLPTVLNLETQCAGRRHIDFLNAIISICNT